MVPAEAPFDRLHLRNVRCFREATLELDPRVTVLLGENGSGKTTLVEALAWLGAVEEAEPAEFPRARRAKSGEMALVQAGRPRPAARWMFGSQGDGSRKTPTERPLFAYGRYRRVLFPEEPGLGPPPTPAQDLDELAHRAGRGRAVTVFEPDNHLLRDLSRYLGALHLGREIDPRLEKVWERLNRSLPELGQGIEGVVMERGRTRYVPKVVRHGQGWELRELSDGYQAILVVIFDLILRYAYLFLDLENPLDGAATVAVDEVDLHLHPRWQRVVVRQLTSLFPNTQLILTTHSPAVVQGAIDRRHRVITLQEGKDGVQPRALTERELKSLEGAEIGSVLLEDRLFDVRSRYSPVFGEVEERVAALQKKMEQGRGTEEDRRLVLRDLERLQELLAKDEARRADGPYLSQMASLRVAFLKDLAAEIEKARG
jgi:energy-coupling factor transporter ATP-binding protein EcfA2